MHIRHLELLRDLRERGSLAAVAAATHRTPSALSQQLRTAQRAAGTPLVEARGRGLRLTEAGELLADGADEVGAALTRVAARLEEHRGDPVGTVRVAGLPSGLTALLPGALTLLAGSRVSVEIDDLDLAETDYARAAADADIVIAHSLTSEVPVGGERLSSSVLVREPLDVAVPPDHPLARRSSLHPGDVVDEPWISVPEGYPFDTVLQRIEAECGRALRRRLRVRDNQLVAALVAAGEGLALLPRYTTRTADEFALVPLVDVPAARWIVALSRPDRAERVAVRLVTARLRAAGAALTGERIP
ncbi:LysR family transcriptional regulator [Janibacter hoylei]|uniref:LysR family transcriptional regulator n=1 Tax=Janibacter hoylei TaxID=364298 RepID=UPI0021A47176|nr:LysR family transcriptional regulator [Janibacter hoylei]MCT1618699.1 LysR family transcriptional regulator [Janibacter hoylei]MCT2291974.1 LysR family transcriptional regulator [Janibacter hoylei]